jgi:hypothetical protein
MDFLVVVIPIPFDKVDGVSAFDVVEAHKVSDSMWLQKKKLLPAPGLDGHTVPNTCVDKVRMKITP